jgi:hypothetical protein
MLARADTLPPRNHPVRAFAILLLLISLSPDALPAQNDAERPRAREAGVVVGILPPGPLNAITDVEGVRVGHATVVEGGGAHRRHRHPPPRGNTFRERVPAAIHVGNGFGKLLGVTQVRELGELETPILLTCTLCVWRAADALPRGCWRSRGWTTCAPSTRGRRDQRRRAERHPRAPDPSRARDRRAGGRRAADRWRGLGGGGHGDRGVRLEGRDRHQLAAAAGGAGRLHRGRAGAEQLRRAC